MFAGDTKVLSVTVQDQDDAIVDLTGAAAEWVLAKQHGAAALITKTVGSGITITQPLNGQLEVLMQPADSVQLRGSYAYQLEITDAFSRKSTVLYGTIAIRRTSTS